MAQTYMRNKLTGEIKDVEVDSAEFYDLRAQVTPTGQSMWEQTNLPHAAAIKERAKFGELHEEDLGHEAQNELRPEALRLDAQGVRPEMNPHLELTPGEIEAGLTREQKLEDLQQQFDERVLGKRRQIFEDAADTIADERDTRGELPGSEGQLARAGGSDDRENVPRPDASQQSGSKGSSSSSGDSGKSTVGAGASSGSSGSGGGDS